jgi:glycosyltransferase involved in cell wall biosynthesis
MWGRRRTSGIDGALCRVAHVSLGLEMGGMEKLLVEFARHADRERFHLHFVCLETRGQLAEEVENLGWRVEAMGKSPGLRPGLVLRLAKIFRRLRADIVHSHNEAACLYGVPAARLARVPMVLNTRHGQGSHLSSRRGGAFAMVAKCAHRVVCVSKDSAELSVQAGIPADRVTTIWNGIDVKKFAFHGPCRGGFAVIVARLAAVKNIDTAIHAVRLACEKVPTLRLRIVGDGPARPSLEALTERLGLRQNVEFAGESQDVPRELADASMFVLPSLSEGISLSLLEAMSAGLPVVATAVGGNAEVVEDGETGILVPAQDSSAMAQAIVRLATNPELAGRMGAAGRCRVETTFDVRAMVRAYEDLYRSELLKKQCGCCSSPTSS